MKISANWLRDYISLKEDAQTLSDRLTLAGLEVDDVIERGSDFEGFVLGQIQEVKPHPNADKLQLCIVDAGTDSPLQIVCGAPNVAAGQTVPVATIGATMPVPLPNGNLLTIRKTKLRGELSEGMICSEMELGLSDHHEGIMVIDSDSKPGTPLSTVIKAEKDTVFDIGLTPNRPDAACHIGVARDLAAVLKRPLHNPYQLEPDTSPLADDSIRVTIRNEELCHRYTALVVRGVSIQESPEWLQQRLLSIGLRPINNVVDATNFVMHEIGQPLHAFDLNRIANSEIVVQAYESDRAFTTLDNKKRTVPAGTLFICDGDGPVAIAGIMGGLDSEVTEETTDILIESAWFNPTSIRKSSKQLALQTDSSYRFERGIDPTLQHRAAERAASLIMEIAGGERIAGVLDVHPVKHTPKQVQLRVARVNHLLGTELPADDVQEILERLEFECRNTSADTFEVTVPPFRPDVTREVDLIEEVGRIYDYNNIPKPSGASFISTEPLTSWETLHETLRSKARSLRYKEITTNSLLSDQEAKALADEEQLIRTLNPVSSDNTTLRPSLAGGFLIATRFNLNRSAKTIRFFELGHTFLKSDTSTWIEGVEERSKLLLGLGGIRSSDEWTGTPSPFSIFDVKADVEAIFNDLGLSEQITTSTIDNTTLHYLLNGTVVCELREADSELMSLFDLEGELFMAEIDVTTLHKHTENIRNVRYQPVSKFPVFEFDIALEVQDSVRAGELAQVIRSSAGSALHGLRVFDVYEGDNLGKGKKSIAFRLSFLDSNKTLTISDVEPMVKKVVEAAEKTFNAKLRS
ncbi:MAG: phenylalanine--tRNA ligase subunit beta [Balneolaceae bacterium]